MLVFCPEFLERKSSFGGDWTFHQQQRNCFSWDSRGGFTRETRPQWYLPNWVSTASLFLQLPLWLWQNQKQIKEGSILARLEGAVPGDRKSWRSEPEAVSCIWSTVQKQREMDAGVPPTSSFSLVWDSSHGLVLPIRLGFSSPSWIFLKMLP